MYVFGGLYKYKNDIASYSGSSNLPPNIDE